MTRISMVRADNPGPLTLTGTNTWILDTGGDSVVVDPGPALPEHRRAILASLQGTHPAAVVLTHAHADHSEDAPALARHLGVPLLARTESIPDAQPLAAGELRLGDVTLEVLSTPGHTADSVTLAVDERLLTGDTVLGFGTTVVAHPDGDLADYLASLATVRSRLAQAQSPTVLPGHGPLLDDPVPVLDYYLEHRRQRLEAVAAAARHLVGDDLSGMHSVGPGDDVVAAVVGRVYTDVPPDVLPAAAISVCAQLVYLARISESGAPDVRYR